MSFNEDVSWTWVQFPAPPPINCVMNKLLIIILIFILSGCHCGEHCIQSHQGTCGGYTTFTLVGKVLIPQYHPKRPCEICDQWEEDK